MRREVKGECTAQDLNVLVWFCFGSVHAMGAFGVAGRYPFGNEDKLHTRVVFGKIRSLHECYTPRTEPVRNHSNLAIFRANAPGEVRQF